VPVSSHRHRTTRPTRRAPSSSTKTPTIHSRRVQDKHGATQTPSITESLVVQPHCHSSPRRRAPPSSSPVDDGSQNTRRISRVPNNPKVCPKSLHVNIVLALFHAHSHHRRYRDSTSACYCFHPSRLHCRRYGPRDLIVVLSRRHCQRLLLPRDSDLPHVTASYFNPRRHSQFSTFNSKISTFNFTFATITTYLGHPPTAIPHNQHQLTPHPQQ